MSARSRIRHTMPLIRRLAVMFLRSTARGSLVRALPEDDPSRSTRLLRALGVPWLFRAVGRCVGFFLPAAAKARIQDSLINRYRIPVDLQRDHSRLRECLRKVFAYKAWRFGADGIGDYLEFGVYQGNSLLEAHGVVEELNLDGVRLFGFDSFEGLPEEAAAEGVWSPGQFRSEEAFTRSRLEEGGVDWRRTRLVPGFFEETLSAEFAAAHDLRRVSVVMIDCDLYSSARQALDFCEPLIVDEAALLFDDWHSTPADEGEQRAFAEFLADNPQFEAEPFETYDADSQVFLVRRVADGPTSTGPASDAPASGGPP